MKKILSFVMVFSFLIGSLAFAEDASKAKKKKKATDPTQELQPVPDVEEVAQVASTSNTSLANPAATNTSTSSIGNLWETLEKSPFSLLVIYNPAVMRDAEKNNGAINGVDNTLWTFLSYKMTENDTVRIGSPVGVTYQAGKPHNGTWYDIRLKYNRSNILTEKKHGIGMSAGINSIWYTTHRNRRENHKNGRIIIGPSFSKSVTDNFSVSFAPEVEIRDRNDGTAQVTSHMVNFYVRPSYAFNDKWSTYLYTKVYQYKQTGTAFRDDPTQIRFIPGVVYTVNDKVSIDAYADMYPWISNDNRFVRNRLGRNITYQFDVAISAF